MRDKKSSRKYTPEQLKVIRSKVMILAASLRKNRGMNKSVALKTAWKMVKQSFNTKVVGVTYGLRQEAIKRLNHYDKKRIRITMQHEAGNEYDKNAVAIIATVIGKGSYKIGYLKREYAAVVSPLLEKGHSFYSQLEAITGTRNKTIGLNFSYVIDPVAVMVANNKKRAHSRQEESSLIAVYQYHDRLH